MPYRIAIFASGSGSNAENIISFFRNNSAFEFPFVLSNKEHARVHQRANELGVPSFTIPNADFALGEPVLDLLAKYQIDYIVLAGFLQKLPDALVRAYPSRIINIHPSLLPKYGGKGMYGDRVHEAVAEAHESESGITIHYVNENYDEGAIIFQVSCALSASDTAEDIANKVHALEYEYYPLIIQKLWS